MKSVTAYLNKQSPVALAGAAALLGVVLYMLAKQAVKDTAAGVKAVAGGAADAAAGVVSGNNAVTQNQTNADGEATTAYEGRGVLGTVGAATNSALGGIPATVGEKLGGWIYDITHYGQR